MFIDVEETILKVMEGFLFYPKDDILLDLIEVELINQLRMSENDTIKVNYAGDSIISVVVNGEWYYISTMVEITND